MAVAPSLCQEDQGGEAESSGWACPSPGWVLGVRGGGCLGRGSCCHKQEESGVMELCGHGEGASAAALRQPAHVPYGSSALTHRAGAPASPHGRGGS